MKRPSTHIPFNSADWISLYRVAASPLLLAAILLKLKIFFVIQLALSLFSDMLDGFIARRLNICTARGARLDSIGDALTFSVAVAGLFVFEKRFLAEHAVAILAAVIPYLAQILFAVIRYGKPTSYHTYLAKLSALLQGVFLLLLLLYKPLDWLFYITIGCTILEIAEEFILMFVAGGRAMNVKGLFWVWKARKKEPKEKITSRFDQSHAAL